MSRGLVLAAIAVAAVTALVTYFMPHHAVKECRTITDSQFTCFYCETTHADEEPDTWEECTMEREAPFERAHLFGLAGFFVLFAMLALALAAPRSSPYAAGVVIGTGVLVVSLWPTWATALGQLWPAGVVYSGALIAIVIGAVAQLLMRPRSR